jgi:hypothetical protein
VQGQARARGVGCHRESWIWHRSGHVRACRQKILTHSRVRKWTEFAECTLFVLVPTGQRHDSFCGKPAAAGLRPDLARRFLSGLPYCMRRETSRPMARDGQAGDPQTGGACTHVAPAMEAPPSSAMPRWGIHLRGLSAGRHGIAASRLSAAGGGIVVVRREYRQCSTAAVPLL